MSKNNKKNKCDMLLVNLLIHLKDDKSENAIFNISEIMNTEKCQEFYDLEHIRDATKKEIIKEDSERLSRIENNTNSVQDEIVAKKVIYRYKAWYIREIEKNIGWRNWFDYEIATTGFYSSIFVGLTTSGLASAAGYSPVFVRASGAIVGMSYKKIKSWFN